MHTLADRFWAKVNKHGPLIIGTPCWVWTAYCASTGYGRISVDGEPREAHRVGFLLQGGVIPGGLVLDHLCENRACVRKSHLEPVTHQENLKRGRGAEVARRKQLAKKHCPQGHPYEGENLAIVEHGRRRCRTCRNEQRRARYLKLKR